MDHACLNYERLNTLHCCGSCFVVRSKKNTKFRLCSAAHDRASGLICGQSGAFSSKKSAVRYPRQLWRIKYADRERDKTLTFLTSNTCLPALTIAEVCKNRWQAELFFKWIKQHLRIQSFYGHSENAVKTQIWIGVSVYVLLAIIRKRLKIEASLYTISQTIDTALFDKMPLNQLLAECVCKPKPIDPYKQMNLFDFQTGQYC